MTQTLVRENSELSSAGGKKLSRFGGGEEYKGWKVEKLTISEGWVCGLGRRGGEEIREVFSVTKGEKWVEAREWEGRVRKGSAVELGEGKT